MYTWNLYNVTLKTKKKKPETEQDTVRLLVSEAFLGSLFCVGNRLQLPWPSDAAKSLQSCPTLCDPIDGSPPGSPVPGILQARTLEWVAVSFSNAWKWKVKVNSLSRVRLLVTSWTAAYQAPLPMGFSRQEYWSGVPLPSPKDPFRGAFNFRFLGHTLCGHYIYCGHTLLCI